ncbi:MAG TPA: hypothetical protein V6C97_20465 [Oculatellaceae cyanobacterium]
MNTRFIKNNTANNLQFDPEEPVQQTFQPEATHKNRLERPVEKHKFVGRAREHQPSLRRQACYIEPPADIRRWVEVLGLDCSNLTADEVQKAWRAQISTPAVHPDLGGEVETAILLNTAKDSLLKWLDTLAPKLGKQFPLHAHQSHTSPLHT